MDLFRMKSLWTEKNGKSWSFFCPLCRATRKVSGQPKPTPMHYGQLALTSVVFAVATSSWFSWKGIVIFVPLAIAFEVVYRARARVALNCPHCGFDPYLYLTDIKRARQEIETHWREKFAEKGIPYPEKPNSGVAPPKADPEAISATFDAMSSNHPGSTANN